MKTVSELLKGLEATIVGDSTRRVTDISFDSRNIQPGSMYVALRGTRQDGHQFVQSAVNSGATTLVVEKPMHLDGVTVVQVPNTMEALKQLAGKFWDFPSKRLLMVGITGTNGKTTTSYLLETILEAAGYPTGVMGTIAYRFRDQTRPAPNTTPFPSDLQRFLFDVAAKGGRACVMEVSSHALALGRTLGTEFDVAVFTNLTQDHLDFHGTMDSYLTAKALLFSGLGDESSTKPARQKAAVINGDDPASGAIRKVSRVPVWTYGLNKPADIYATDLLCDASGSRFVLHIKDSKIPISFGLLGDFNVMNALAAAGAAFTQGIPLETIKRGLEKKCAVPGRLERIEASQPFTVVVDYAHTDDALRQVLSTLRKLKPARLITVFGCGGDRDRTKRPLMGETAAQLSDEVIVTSDNPRSEDPAAIALDIEVGIRRVRSDHYATILDRRQAIQVALGLARPGDLVLIAGKGHETYQIVGRDTFPFDDREVVREILRQKADS